MHFCLLHVSILGPAGVYRCKEHKKRDADYHAEITAVIVVAQTTESNLVHSAGRKKGNECKFWYALVHIQVGFYRPIAEN
jgi:hypothetical protein